MKRVLGLAVVLLVGACGGGGPGSAELKRACIDSGAFTMDQDPGTVCSCVINGLKKSGADMNYIMNHWERQSGRSFGKSLLPASAPPSIKQSCRAYG